MGTGSPERDQQEYGGKHCHGKGDPFPENRGIPFYFQDTEGDTVCHGNKRQYDKQNLHEHSRFLTFFGRWYFGSGIHATMSVMVNHSS